MKEQMYEVINTVFKEFVDGQNKDGVFLTIDGQQYNIKIVAKKKPVLFEGQTITTNLPSISIIDWDEEKQKEVEKLFEGLIDNV